MKTYQQMKEKTRDEAIAWQTAFSEESLSYGELCEIYVELNLCTLPGTQFKWSFRKREHIIFFLIQIN